MGILSWIKSKLTRKTQPQAPAQGEQEAAKPMPVLCFRPARHRWTCSPAAAEQKRQKAARRIMRRCA